MCASGKEGRFATTIGAPAEAPSRASATDRFYLLVFEGDSSSVFELPRNGEVILGRGEDASLRLNDPAASRRHAKITMTGGEARISDLGSQNGTLVNHERVSGSRMLASTDILSICTTTLLFHSSARPPAARALLEFPELRLRAEEELARTLGYQRPLTIAAISLGAGGGDRPRVSAVLADQLRRIDIAGWGGGDLLLILMPEMPPEAAMGATSRLVQSLAGFAPNAKAGFVTCPADGCHLDTLIASARAAAVEARRGAVAAATDTYRTISFGDVTVVVADPAMTRLYDLIERLAASDLPVLVHGETGTGKELAASALHYWSRRRGRPLVAMNCAALQEQLVESELFGHDRGAFTGARASKPGLFEVASGGTVFLDEVGELPATVQAKLLRVLETKRVTRLGDVREREVDIRVVAATNRNLNAEVKAGRFRQDLAFRLCGATLWIPPLRDRLRELPILAQSFLAAACVHAGRPPMTISARAMQDLSTYGWPGNVRELKNIMDYAAATVSDPVLEPWHLADRLYEQHAPPSSSHLSAQTPLFRPIEEEIRELERSRMAAALATTLGNQTKAANLISMPLRTFVTKMRQYSLTPRRGGQSDPDSNRGGG